MTNPNLEEGSDNSLALSSTSNDVPKGDSIYVDIEKYVKRSCFNLIFILIDWMLILIQFQMINIRIIQQKRILKFNRQMKNELISNQINFLRKKLNHNFVV